MPAVVLAPVLFVLGAIAADGGPVRLARHPDYHSGTVAFSYLGDIWTANGDASAVQRITDNSAHEVYPRVSPDRRKVEVRRARRAAGSGIRDPGMRSGFAASSQAYCAFENSAADSGVQ